MVNETRYGGRIPPRTPFSIKCGLMNPVLHIRLGDQVVVLPTEKQQRRPVGPLRETVHRFGRLMQFARFRIITGHRQFHDALLTVAFEKGEFGKRQGAGERNR